MPKVADKKVLLCRPTHFTVSYKINPHMKPESVNRVRAMQQWNKLVKTLESIGVGVEVIEQESDVPDMVFAADQGIIKDGSVIMANFHYPQRIKESEYYRGWFKSNDYKLKSLPKNFSLEGGDALFFNEILFLGTGFRATTDVSASLSGVLDIDVVPLKLVDPRFYHLDTCLLIIDSSTAFYYPPAFSKDSQSLLKLLVPNLLPLSSQAAMSFAANSYVRGSEILVHSEIPADFQKALEDLGLTVHKVDVSEFLKAGGGIHCLIKSLT